MRLEKLRPDFQSGCTRRLLRSRDGEQHDPIHQSTDFEYFLAVGQDDVRLNADPFYQRPGQQLAQNERNESRPVQKCLSSVWFDGRGALELKRSAETVRDQQTSHEAAIADFDRGQKANSKACLLL